MNLPGARRRGTTSCKEEIENYAKRNSTVFITRDYTTIKLIRLSNFYINTAATRHTSQTQKNALRSVQSFLLLSYPADLTLNKARMILLSQLLTNNRTTLCGTPKTAPLPVCSSIATTPCRNMCSDLRTHPASPRFLNSAIAAIIARAFYNNRKWGISAIAGNQDKFQFLSANMMALIGTVLYNAIKEYHDDGTRKTIHFYGYTVEDNYNAIRKKWKRLSEIRRLLIWDALKQQIAIHANYIENSGSNVTVPDDHHDNDVDNILMKCTDDERQRYNTLIEDYNCAGKREDNILTIDKCRTSHSNEEDIEADEREEETRVQLRESSGEIHDILLREFRGADDFTESVTHNDDEQELELEDCDALVERYEEEINCSDLYSTV
ncbi:hypothetical protein HBI33_226590 [Parastagonospora nodorum]|nr:hypothetical protein HBI33_226590 [Parastagonospora nodorum]